MLRGDALKGYLDENFEVDRFLRYVAMNVLLGKWDDYWTMGNNYYLYFSNEGRIEFIPFDYDNALGDSFFYTPATGIYEWGSHFNDFMALNSGLPIDFINWVFPSGSPLVERIFEIDEYRNTYEGYIQEFIRPADELFVYSDYEKKYNQLHELYAPYLDNDIDEGEEMIDRESTGRYFFERTKSAAIELGLDEGDYETRPANLNAPTGFSATDETYKAMIAVTWDSVLFADYYGVYRSNSPGGIYERISEDISATSFNDEAVAVDSSYYYKVKAFTNDGIESAFSLESSGSTNDGTIIAPTGVSATDGTYNHMITVSWDAVLNVDYYRVYRSNAAGGLFEQISEDITATTFNDKTIGDYSVYDYKVKAFTYEGAETGFSLEDWGSASATGLSAPKIIRGAALVRGTYIRSDDTGVITYTFDENGTCRVSRPVVDILGNTVLEGTWGYNNDGTALTVDVTRSFGAATLHFSEFWENAFTVNNGAVLNLLGFKKTTGDQDGIVGRYEGTGIIHVEVGAGMDDVVIEIEAVFTVNDDITWDLEFTLNEDGNVTRFSEAGSGFANKLIEFGGSYYLPVVGLSYARIPRPMSATLHDKRNEGIPGTMSDLHLQNNRGLDLTTINRAYVLKIRSILSNSLVPKRPLRDLFMENKDIFE